MRIVTKEVVDVISSEFDIVDDGMGSITYFSKYGSWSSTVTVGYEFDASVVSWGSEVPKSVYESEFKEIQLFISFIEGILATLEVLKNESI